MGATSSAEADDPLVIKDRGLYFDGVDDQVMIDPTGSNINLAPSFSIFFWGRFSTSRRRLTGGGHVTILGRGYGTSPQWMISTATLNIQFLMLIENGSIKANVHDGLTVSDVSSSTSTIDNGDWYNIGLVCYYTPPDVAQTVCELRIGGTKEATKTISGYTDTATSLLADSPSSFFIIAYATTGFMYNFILHNEQVLTTA